MGRAKKIRRARAEKPRGDWGGGKVSIFLAASPARQNHHATQAIFVYSLFIDK